MTAEWKTCQVRMLQDGWSMCGQGLVSSNQSRHAVEVLSLLDLEGLTAVVRICIKFEADPETTA